MHHGYFNMKYIYPCVIYFYFHKKILSKILGFEALFNQLMDKVRRNVKLRKHLPKSKT